MKTGDQSAENSQAAENNEASESTGSHSISVTVAGNTFAAQTTNAGVAYAAIAGATTVGVAHVVNSSNDKDQNYDNGGGSACAIFYVQNKYDNDILNHRDLLNYLYKKYSLSDYKKLIELDLSKEELLEVVNSCGFDLLLGHDSSQLES